jgi:hypothetical protein
MTADSSPHTDQYEIVDPVLLVWAQRHDLQIQNLDRNYPVRSTWITGPGGKAQIWLGWPISAERIEIFAAKLDLSIREQWSSRSHQIVTLPDLATALEDIFETASGWVAASR